MNAIARESCLDYYNSGFVTDGVYTLEPLLVVQSMHTVT